MKKLVTLYISFCFVFILSAAQAQSHFRFKNISINQGLSQSTVSSIVEDSRGMLWFGTFDGLNKYNGKNFSVFRAQGSSYVKLKANKINNLFLAPNDQLFIYSDGGLDILDLKTEKLLRIKNLENAKMYAPCLYEKDNVLCSNEQGRLILYNPFTYKIKTLPQFKNISDPANRISEILLLDNKLILIYEKNKIQLISKDGALVQEYVVDNILQKGQLYNGVLLVSTLKQGIFEINFNTKKLQWYTNTVGVLNVVKTNLIDKQMYAMTYGQGILKVDTTLKKIIELPDNVIENKYITSSYQDNRNNLWIGTDGSGLNYYNKSQLIFSTITPGYLGSVRGVVQGGDNLYIATFSEGCFSYNLSSGKVERIFYDPKKICNAIGYHQGKLWIGYDHNGVDIYDLAKKRLVHNIPFLEKSLLTQYKSRIYRIDDFDEENMVVSTRYEGFALINKKTYQIQKKINQTNYSLAGSDVRYVYLDKAKQRVYAAMVYDGLAVFSYPECKLIKNIKTIDKSTTQLSVKFIREDDAGNIWLGTNGSGILVYDKNYKEIGHWNTENHLKNDVVYGILEEKPQAIWLSSNKGISRIQYELAKGKILVKDVQDFNINNGLQSNEFNTGAYCSANNGSLAFGGLNNLNVFNPRKLRFDRRNSNVCITDFLVHNQVFQTEKTVSYLDKINLKPNQNDIGISFIVPGYNEGIAIEYRYRLLGYQSTWQYIGSRNNIDFTNLPAGKYTFEVQSRYLNNLWGKDITRLELDIETPFYKSWWFYLLLIAGTLLLIGSFIRLRIQYINSANKNRLRLMIESQEVERSRISRELHDDFGGRLSTLKLHMEAIKIQPERAREIAQSTSQIIDQSIAELRNILLNLSPKTLSDDGLDIALQEIALSINKTKLLQVSLSYSLITDLKPSASISIYRIVYELINNTIKHAEATEIDISLTQRKDALVLHYEDNGNGVTKINNSKGYGLSNINIHLQVHNALHYIDTKQGKGYHFTAEFPLDILS